MAAASHPARKKRRPPNPDQRRRNPPRLPAGRFLRGAWPDFAAKLACGPVRGLVWHFGLRRHQPGTRSASVSAESDLDGLHRHFALDLVGGIGLSGDTVTSANDNVGASSRLEIDTLFGFYGKPPALASTIASNAASRATTPARNE